MPISFGPKGEPRYFMAPLGSAAEGVVTKTMTELRNNQKNIQAKVREIWKLLDLKGISGYSLTPYSQSFPVDNVEFHFKTREQYQAAMVQLNGVDVKDARFAVKLRKRTEHYAQAKPLIAALPQRLEYGRLLFRKMTIAAGLDDPDNRMVWGAPAMNTMPDKARLFTLSGDWDKWEELFQATGCIQISKADGLRAEAAIEDAKTAREALVKEASLSPALGTAR